MLEPKATLIKFTAKEIKQRDITRFRNLLIKLGVKIKQVDIKKKIIGRKIDLVIYDEGKKLTKREFDELIKFKVVDLKC